MQGGFSNQDHSVQSPLFDGLPESFGNTASVSESATGGFGLFVELGEFMPALSGDQHHNHFLLPKNPRALADNNNLSLLHDKRSGRAHTEPHCNSSATLSALCWNSSDTFPTLFGGNGLNRNLGVKRSQMDCQH